MNLFKIILFIFIVYFIRRFIQMYRALKAIQLEREMQEAQEQKKQDTKNSDTIEADYKVMD